MEIDYVRKFRRNQIWIVPVIIHCSCHFYLLPYPLIKCEMFLVLTFLLSYHLVLPTFHVDWSSYIDQWLDNGNNQFIIQMMSLYGSPWDLNGATKVWCTIWIYKHLLLSYHQSISMPFSCIDIIWSLGTYFRYVWSVIWFYVSALHRFICFLRKFDFKEVSNRIQIISLNDEQF